jgi:hypothetical protein
LLLISIINILKCNRNWKEGNFLRGIIARGFLGGEFSEGNFQGGIFGGESSLGGKLVDSQE